MVRLLELLHKTKEISFVLEISEFCFVFLVASKNSPATGDRRVYNICFLLTMLKFGFVRDTVHFSFLNTSSALLCTS